MTHSGVFLTDFWVFGCVVSLCILTYRLLNHCKPLHVLIKIRYPNTGSVVLAFV